MSEEWGPWIEHDGRGCPVLVGEYLQVEHLFKSGVKRIETGLVKRVGGGSWRWDNYPKYTKVVRYRIRKPRGLTILEEVADGIREPEGVI